MNGRVFALPLAAFTLVGAVLGVQVAAGGLDYRPAAAPAVCDASTPPIPQRSDLDGLTQAVVVDGVRRAACDLHTTRERLLVALPSAADRAALARELGTSDAAILAAVRAGLLTSVARLERTGALPPVSSLLEDLVARMGLPEIAQSAARQIPSGVVDDLLPTGAILNRAISTVDLAVVLDGMGDPGSLESALAPAIRDAALAEARARLSERIGSLSGLFGFGG
jgi:hypothetical protein